MRSTFLLKRLDFQNIYKKAIADIENKVVFTADSIKIQKFKSTKFLIEKVPQIEIKHDKLSEVVLCKYFPKRMRMNARFVVYELPIKTIYTTKQEIYKALYAILYSWFQVI